MVNFRCWLLGQQFIQSTSANSLDTTTGCKRIQWMHGGTSIIQVLDDLIYLKESCEVREEQTSGPSLNPGKWGQSFAFASETLAI